uniref:hypothetical protein n=1 Tax=Enterocloster clostridioformis TaxID=1531 RepID=UPI0026ED1447|nr:hypothetical protein [Enterocloster clostridioformis]
MSCFYNPPIESRCISDYNLKLYLKGVLFRQASGKGGCARSAGILYALNRQRLGLPGLITPNPAPDRQQMDKLAWLEKGWYEGVLAFACEAGGKGGNEAGIDAIWKGREEAGTTAGRNAGIIGRTG